MRIPNLKSANPSFAARLILYVRDRFGGNAPRIYGAAHLSRKTYSSIIGNELRIPPDLNDEELERWRKEAEKELNRASLVEAKDYL